MFIFKIWSDDDEKFEEYKKEKEEIEANLSKNMTEIRNKCAAELLTLEADIKTMMEENAIQM